MHVSQRSGEVYLDARNNCRPGQARVYGVLVGVNATGLFVPIGRQSCGSSGQLSPVPICIGGGRDMQLTAGGLVNETDKAVIAREAMAEIHEELNIGSTRVLTVHGVSGVHARYLRVNLSSNLPVDWSVRDSDQVVAVRWWPLPGPRQISNMGNSANPLLAQRMFDDLQCGRAFRAAWSHLGHAKAYQAVISEMLTQARLLAPFGRGAARGFPYHNSYAPCSAVNTLAHALSCSRRCFFTDPC